MKLAIDQVRFRRELTSWAVRIPLCALPSAAVAVLAFFQPFELAAMALGMALFVGAAAWFCSWEPMGATLARQQFVRSLKMAAGLKAVLLLAAAVGAVLTYRLKMEWGWCLMIGLLPDIWAGFGSLWLINLLAGRADIGQIHGFGWVLAVTILQGAAISAGLGLLAAGFCGGNRAWAWWARQKSFPVRIWG